MAKTSTTSPLCRAVIQRQREKIKTAAIYIRCSSDEAKKQGYSPETQQSSSERAVNIDGNKLNEECVYKDIGLSGGTDKRPGLQKLLEDAKTGKFDIVYVSRMDRFFRSLPLLIKTVNELKSLGIEFKSATEPFDTTTPTGRAMFHMAGTFAEWQREVGLEARNEGMLKAMREGKWLGGTPPYGYKRNEKTKKLEVDKKEAPIIRMLYIWLVEKKLSEYKIQQKINGMKIPTKYDRLGKEKKTKSKYWWNRRTIARIFRNEIYTGVFFYRKRKYLGRVRGENNLRPKKDWIKVEDKNLKIISRDLFQKAQRQLKKNKELSPRNTKQSYVLQHKIVCGFDGYRYQCATRHYHNKHGQHRKTKYYFCTGNRSYFTPNHCLAPSISESRIVPPVWNKLKEILSNPKLIMKELEDYIGQKSKESQIRKEINSLKNNIKALQRKRERYAELYAEGSIKKEFYNKKVERCDKDKENIQKEEEKLAQFLFAEEEKQKRIMSVENLHNQLKESLENATYEVKREVLQRLVGRVIKTGNKLDIGFNLPFTVENSLEPAPVVSGDRRRMD